MRRRRKQQLGLYESRSVPYPLLGPLKMFLITLLGPLLKPPLRPKLLLMLMRADEAGTAVEICCSPYVLKAGVHGAKPATLVTAARPITRAPFIMLQCIWHPKHSRRWQVVCELGTMAGIIESRCSILINTDLSTSGQQDDLIRDLEHHPHVAMKIRAIKQAITLLLSGEVMPRCRSSAVVAMQCFASVPNLAFGRSISYLPAATHSATLALTDCSWLSSKAV